MPPSHYYFQRHAAAAMMPLFDADIFAFSITLRRFRYAYAALLTPFAAICPPPAAITLMRVRHDAMPYAAAD